MQKHSRSWLRDGVALTPLLLGILIFAFAKSTFGDEFRERAVAPLEFKLRQQFGRAPELSPQLKVIVYGNKARKEFGLQEKIPLARWGEFIAAIASRHPRAILFDKFFSFTDTTVEERKAFSSAVSALGTKVIAGAVFDSNLASAGVYNLSQFAAWDISRMDRLKRGSIEYLLGPDVELRDAFQKLGSLSLDKGSTVEPAWLETSSGLLLPHLSLSFAERVRLHSNRIEVENSTLYLDRFNRIPVNFVERTKTIDDALGAAPIFRQGAKAPILQKIKDGDVVLVLPSMYTGSTDFKNSPIGRIEGGLYHVSLINSVVRNVPLKPFLQEDLSFLFVLVLLAVGSGATVLFFRFRLALATLFVTAGLLIFLGLVGFSYFSLQTDWHLYSAFIISNGGTLLLARTISEQRQAERVEGALEGMVSKEVLTALKQTPDALYRRPNEQTLTVMFVDIEGFSLRTKELLSVDVFSTLHTQISTISQIIHSHGGVIDRILGDGLMCFFGYQFDEQKDLKSRDHAEHALRCAVEIQRRAATITAAADPNSTSGALIPLRIGLCSGEAFLGNLGAGRRVDFTIIGNTVNMAKRYEDACEVFRIYLSASTYQFLKEHNALERFNDISLRGRLMSLKHHKELILGWECDPFLHEQELYMRAVQNSRSDTAELNTSGGKPYDVGLNVTINHDDQGRVRQLNQETLLIVCSQYYCRKVILFLQLEGSSAHINESLAQAALASLFVQVVAGRPHPDGGFEHLATLVHLSLEKRRQLATILAAKVA